MAATTSRTLVRFRIVLWVLVALAAIAATVLFVMRPAPTLGVTGKPFALESTAGGTFTQDNLKGLPSLVFFGYTNCPDVCPTTLAESVAWKEALGVTDAQLRTIFVTVDPARDTAAVLKDYLGGFDPDVIGLVGSEDQTVAAKAAFGVSSEKGEDDGSGFYLVNHTATLFLIGRDGEFEGTIAYGEPKDTAIGKIKKLLAS